MNIPNFEEQKLNAILKEIESTGKYPKAFQYLPAYYNNDTDNTKLLNADNDPTIVAGDVLLIKEELLGTNKKAKGFTKVLAFGVIYIIWAKGTNLYKIGITDNIKRRFKDISAASPLPVCIVKYGKCDNPHLIENALHDMFASKWVKNEWFQLTENELFEAFAYVDQFYNV